jgi:hypothetical protein
MATPVQQKFVKAAASVLLAAAAVLPARAQLLADPVAVPAQPAPFEMVNVRLVVDDCVFNPDSVRVSSEQGLTQIAMTWRACLIAGPTKVVDIQVGSFAVGTQRVNVVVNPPVGLGPSRVWTVTFNVVPLAEPALFPPLAKPLTNYTGMWWNPRESGWGLSINQSATAQVFVAWYVYDANGQPVWYTIQMGRWTDFRTWTGTVYRTAGPVFFGAAFDPALVQLAPLGTATFSFDQTPATVDTATFTYTVGGVTAAKTISRMRF